MDELKDDRKLNEDHFKNFKNAMDDNLNVSKALSIIWGLLRDKEAEGKYQTIKQIDSVLNLNLLDKPTIIIPKKVQELVQKREEARMNKNWIHADSLRNKLIELGWQIDDTPEGPRIKKHKYKK